MQLNHIHLKSKNPPALIEFYQTYFSLEVLEQNEIETYLGERKGTWLTISPRSETETSLPGWFHFGFCLDSREEVENLFSRMKLEGLSFPRELTSFGDEGLTFYVTDPDSNKVEVSWIRKHQDGN